MSKKSPVFNLTIPRNYNTMDKETNIRSLFGKCRVQVSEKNLNVFLNSLRRQEFVRTVRPADRKIAGMERMIGRCIKDEKENDHGK